MRGDGLGPGAAITPTHPQVLFNVAAVQCQLGLWAEATRSLEEAISKGPEGARGDLDIALGQVQVRRARLLAHSGGPPGLWPAV